MFHIPLTNPMLILSDFALANAKADIKELDDAVSLHQDMQDNLNGSLTFMPVLADIVQEWQTEELDNELITFYNLLRKVEYKLNTYITASDGLKVYMFIRGLHPVLSGTQMDVSGVTLLFDLIDSSYLPFAVSYFQNVVQQDH